MKSPELSKLKAGDIIFARSDGFLSRVIRHVTRSEWSHVAIYLGEGQVIDTDALRSVSIHQLSSFECWAAGRVEDLSDQRIGEIVNYMVSELNKPYDYLQLVGFFLDYTFGWAVNWQWKGHYTCGQLIDRAFHVAQIDLVPGKTEGNVTPEDIYSSPIVRRV